MLPHFDAVVFDCDGVLADSEEVWGLAQQALCERHHVAWTAELAHRTHGMSYRAAVALLAGLMDDPPPLESLEQELLAVVTPLLCGSVRPLPGAVELMHELARRVPVAVASNTPRCLLDPMLETLGVTPVLDAVVGADEVPLPKPAPDVYREATRRLRVEPARTLVFEDSPTGAAAAVAAGCMLLGVTARGRPPLDGVLFSIGGLNDVWAHLPGGR